MRSQAGCTVIPCNKMHKTQRHLHVLCICSALCISMYIYTDAYFLQKQQCRDKLTGERLKPSAAIVPLRAHPTLQGAIVTTVPAVAGTKGLSESNRIYHE